MKTKIITLSMLLCPIFYGCNSKLQKEHDELQIEWKVISEETTKIDVREQVRNKEVVHVILEKGRLTKEEIEKFKEETNTLLFNSERIFKEVEKFEEKFSIHHGKHHCISIMHYL